MRGEKNVYRNDKNRIAIQFDTILYSQHMMHIAAGVWMLIMIFVHAMQTCKINE